MSCFNFESILKYCFFFEIDSKKINKQTNKIKQNTHKHKHTHLDVHAQRSGAASGSSRREFCFVYGAFYGIALTGMTICWYGIM